MIKLLRKILSRIIVYLKIKRIKVYGVNYDLTYLNNFFRHLIIRGIYEKDELSLVKHAVDEIKETKIKILELGGAIGYISLNITKY
jgi:hypothetical protein